MAARLAIWMLEEIGNKDPAEKDGNDDSRYIKKNMPFAALLLDLGELIRQLIEFALQSAFALCPGSLIQATVGQIFEFEALRHLGELLQK